ncbi:alpha-xylosidase [Polaribacter pacificus]|uniref:Alpha-xylosidase n=1 Tax=Polaribacter pacificus TaxID=1775173 RepID=A0A917I1A2_9FLAO|nr:alpha-xylosidase [Polaribacter pacificus]
MSLLSLNFILSTSAQNTKTTEKNLKILSIERVNATTFQLNFNNQQNALIDFYSDHIFRFFQDPNNKGLRAPEANPPAEILVKNPRRTIKKLRIHENPNQFLIFTDNIQLLFNKKTTLFKVINLKNQAVIIEQLNPIVFTKTKTTLTLKENQQEYFYGGGVQNGRFSHKGKSIAIENQNSWTDGGVASPNPYFWSSNGYGFMGYTFKKGVYDFGDKKQGVVTLTHETDYLDTFFMIGDKPADLLANYYQLTGNPALLPKFGFYQGHLNAYNRDYWKKDTTGILFEDGNTYKEQQKDNGGIKESLNGEKNNYQFSARAVIDRYSANDMPLGWILPNDGYGAGYGQTNSLDGNIQNLKEFGDYARKKGVEIGLWTQSDLHPKEGISALLQRDLIKEVKTAGVRVLKTDVAWVGQGYSFGLNGIADAANILSSYGSNARPFIISLDGWAGTQRYASVWSGDQTGGVWEYIRFHIPTYIGAGLSGMPNITSDMDGIFGGKNPAVLTRDFQWKTFTPMQLNMDGWGANIKYPHALGEPTTSINRNYLKLKSALLPYSYSIAKEAVTGLPMMRAIFLEDRNTYTQGISTQYEFLYGPYFLIAPIYKETKIDTLGNDIRNGIYLPKGLWLDYFTGEPYTGGQVINDFESPIYKLPVFVKRGAIIPLVAPNNTISEIDKQQRIYEIYPHRKSAFTVFDDDGKTTGYTKGKSSSTYIESDLSDLANLRVSVHPTKGGFNGFEAQKTTEFRINTTQKPKTLTALIGLKEIELKEVKTLEDFDKKTNVYWYNKQPDFNQFSTKGSSFEKVSLIKNPQIWVKIEKTDVSQNKVELTIDGLYFDPKNTQKQQRGNLSSPENITISPKNTQAYSLKPTWTHIPNTDYFEIDFNGMRYTTIKENFYVFENLKPDTHYRFKIRSVNLDGASDWKIFTGKTAANPLKFAIKNMVGTSNVKDQGGSEIFKLFDFDENSMWHTVWGKNSVPFELTIDLKSLNQLDKFQYLPRAGKRNGVFLKGTVFYSQNKKAWMAAGDFTRQDHEGAQEFVFKDKPMARYIKLVITEAVGGFGSGKELYVFKVPGTETYIPGDINQDKKIDNNDLVSYTNYIGLKKGDADFDGYISKGDVNTNGIIDAYDVSVVATQLEGGTANSITKSISGNLQLQTAKRNFKKNELIDILIQGENLNEVNAFSFALKYNSKLYEYVGNKTINTAQMLDLTKDRSHKDGTQVLYPTFVNIGNQKTISGSLPLFRIQFKAKQNLTFNLDLNQLILVDKNLNSLE